MVDRVGVEPTMLALRDEIYSLAIPTDSIPLSTDLFTYKINTSIKFQHPTFHTLAHNSQQLFFLLYEKHDLD